MKLLLMADRRESLSVLEDNGEIDRNFYMPRYLRQLSVAKSCAGNSTG